MRKNEMNMLANSEINHYIEEFLVGNEMHANEFYYNCKRAFKENLELSGLRINEWQEEDKFHDVMEMVYTYLGSFDRSHSFYDWFLDMCNCVLGNKDVKEVVRLER